MVYPQIGTVSRGTMRDEHLIPALYRLLVSLQKANGDETDFFDTIEEAVNQVLDHPSEVMLDLMDALEQYAPPYTYFGAHEGDGSDYGYWPDIDDAIQDGSVIRVNDLAALPDNFVGDYALVSDHGNLTVGHAEKGAYTTYWTIV